MGLAEEGQHVVLAEAVEVDVLDDHHLVVGDGEQRLADHLLGPVVALGQERGPSPPAPACRQALAVRILPQPGQELTDRILHRHPHLREGKA